MDRQEEAELNHYNFCPADVATIGSQPGMSLQESHSLLSTTLMPQDKDTLTQNSMSEVGGGFDKGEPQKSAKSL
jgi:hypothetical protein